MQIGCVSETALYVTEIQRSIDFYKRVLGFTPAEQPSNRMCALRVTDSQVLLLFKKGGSVVATVTPYGIIPPTDGEGNLHVCFLIPGSDFQLWQRRLGEFGVEIESVVSWPAGGRSIYFRDPDNHAIELKTSHWDGPELSHL